MSDPVPESVREQMVRTANRVRDDLRGGASSYPRYDLTGKNAIVQPGQFVIMRLLPRWDIRQKYMINPKTKKVVENPAYVPGVIYVPVFEHWYTRSSDNKRAQAWCPRTWDRSMPCPLCEAAADLGRSPDDADRKAGKDLSATSW